MTGVYLDFVPLPTISVLSPAVSLSTDSLSLRLYGSHIPYAFPHCKTIVRVKNSALDDPSQGKITVILYIFSKSRWQRILVLQIPKATQAVTSQLAFSRTQHNE